MSADEVSCIPSEAWIAHVGKDLLDGSPEGLVELQVEVAADGHQQIVDAAQLHCKSLFIVPSWTHIWLGSVRAVGNHLQYLGPGAGLPYLQSMCQIAVSPDSW